MTRPADAVVIAALEAQSSELSVVLARLEAARSTLIPDPGAFWQGAARLAAQSATDALTTTVDAGIAAVRSALSRTEAGIAGLAARE